MPALVASADRPVPGRPVGDHGVGAVQVLVDVLDEVGDPQLREHVVGRVVVAVAGALGRLEPADQLGRARSGGAGAGAGSATQPRTTGSAGSSAPPIASGVTTQ